MFCAYWLYISITALAEFHVCLIDFPIVSLWAQWQRIWLNLFLYPWLRGKCLAQPGYSICCCLVTQLCPTPWDHKDCSVPGFLVLQYFLELAQTDVHWVRDATQSLSLHFSSCPQSFPESGSFPMSQFFRSGGQSVGASASASIFNKYFLNLRQEHVLH